ncbi:hypothetical protein SteCoe_32344 [Stentor coeruleus]|uniref:EF-hand domain-containing protein n=1 Tax=Stentor coeruleus TaxID=5963 RepID=A0A1R2AZ65_9CILI|nr:hypothetical protein SteCoe_32344 [Stentor coeruleus]
MEKLRPYTVYASPPQCKKLKSAGSVKNDMILKDRLSPVHSINFFSKEELFQQIFALKTKLNTTSEENKQLKGKLTRLEKKHNNTLPSPSSLRNRFAYISEPDKQKLYIKITELEYENKVLKDENDRNKDIINQLIGKPPPEYKKIYEKYVQQCAKIKKLKDQLMLAHTGHGNVGDNENRGNKLSNRKNERQYYGKRDRIMWEKKGNMFLIEIFRKMFENSCAKKMDYEGMWEIIDEECCDLIGVEEFVAGMRRLGVDNSKEEIEKFFDFIAKDKKIDQRGFEKALLRCKPPTFPQYKDLKFSLEHLYHRLQIQRMTFKNFAELFSSETLEYEEIFNILSSSPINLDKASTETITKFVLFNSNQIDKKVFESKLLHMMGEWKILSDNQEINFDDYIKFSLEGFWDDFLNKCQIIDKEKSEMITFYQFTKVCKSFGFEFDKDLEQYLKILFYTDKFQLNIVPYTNFIIAYSPEINNQIADT